MPAEAGGSEWAVQRRYRSIVISICSVCVCVCCYVLFLARSLPSYVSYCYVCLQMPKRAPGVPKRLFAVGGDGGGSAAGGFVVIFPCQLILMEPSVLWRINLSADWRRAILGRTARARETEDRGVCLHFIIENLFQYKLWINNWLPRESPGGTGVTGKHNWLYRFFFWPLMVVAYLFGGFWCDGKQFKLAYSDGAVKLFYLKIHFPFFLFLHSFKNKMLEKSERKYCFNIFSTKTACCWCGLR